MSYNFFATVSRMKYIERWALMRSSRAETLSEHSLETAMIAHALCTIGNTRYGGHLDADRAAVIGLYHDASEIMTGDMPTPVKYYNSSIRDAYKAVEAVAQDRLLDRSAYIKCIEEENAGNSEFRTARQTIWGALQKMMEEMPEVRDFVRDFLPPYGKTLDELN